MAPKRSTTKPLDPGTMPPTAAELQRAYTASIVEVDLPEQTYCRSPSDSVSTEPYPHTLRPHCWVITAHNPGSVLLTKESNAERHGQLMCDVVQTTLPYFTARGRSRDSSWQEASLAVVGLSEAEAMRLGRKYEQIAVFLMDSRGVRVVPVIPESH